MSAHSTLFTCPADVARDTSAKPRKGRQRPLCVDLHCHVHTPAVDDLVRDHRASANEPAAHFTNALTAAANRRQFQNVRLPLTSVEQRLADMDRMHVDVQAISASPGQFLYWLDPDIGREAARMVNENLASIVAAHPKRFVALATVPLQSTEAAVEELEYAVRTLGCRGVEIGTNVLGQEISRDRDAFWAKVQELDVMVFLHPNGFTDGQRLSDHYFNNVIGNPLDTTVAVGHLVFDGILERFPRLKIVAAHGGGYIAHYPGRMDHVWAARDDAGPELKKAPSKSLAKLYFDTIVFDRKQLKHLVALWGADHIVIGTDYPFDMGHYDPRGLVGRSTFLDKAEKARILGGNAAELLKLTQPGRKRNRK